MRPPRNSHHLLSGGRRIWSRRGRDGPSQTCGRLIRLSGDGDDRVLAVISDEFSLKRRGVQKLTLILFRDDHKNGSGLALESSFYLPCTEVPNLITCRISLQTARGIELCAVVV